MPEFNIQFEKQQTQEKNVTLDKNVTYDYNILENKPSINNVEISRNITLEQIGAQEKGDYATNTRVNEIESSIPVDFVSHSELSSVENKIPIDNMALSNGAGYQTAIQVNTIIDSKGFVTQAKLENEINTISNKLKISRIYDSGVSSDTVGYAKVLELKNSSPFDISKVEVVGNPMITADGMASGFSTTSFVTLNKPFNPDNKTWEMFFKFKTPATWADGALISNGVGHNNKVCILLTGRKFRLYASSEKPNNTIANDVRGSYQMLNNTVYYVRLKFTGMQYILEYSLDGKNFVQDIVINSSLYVYPHDGLMAFGVNAHDSNMLTPWQGEIYLKDFYIKTAGETYYNTLTTGIDTVNINGENVEIPYTQAKDGTKIIDVQYWDRTQDWFNQSGEGNYLMIDEGNCNFALPKPNLYGIIAKMQKQIDELRLGS